MACKMMSRCVVNKLGNTKRERSRLRAYKPSDRKDREKEKISTKHEMERTTEHCEENNDR